MTVKGDKIQFNPTITDPRVTEICLYRIGMKFVSPLTSSSEDDCRVDSDSDSDKCE